LSEIVCCYERRGRRRERLSEEKKRERERGLSEK